MGLRERKKDNTRLQILEAALGLIDRQGFENTTINEIAAVVGISSRTVLRYFPTKEDVIVSWVEDGMALFLEVLQSRPPNEAAYESLLASARKMLLSYQERAEFYLTIERVIASSASIAARKQQMSSELGDKVCEVLAARGESKCELSLHISLCAAIVFAVLRVVIKNWVSLDGKPKLLDLFDKASAFINIRS